MVYVTGDITGIDQIEVTVLEPQRALLSGRRLPAPAADLTLPAEFVLDESGRTGPARLLVWGLAAGARVAFGATAIELGSDSDVSVRLAEPPPDCDDDGIPDPEDGCPEHPDPEQDDPDLDGVTGPCAEQQRCDGNLVADPGFEMSIAGWLTVNGEHASTQPGRGRSRVAVRACQTSDYYLNFKFQNFATVQPGAQVRVRGFARSVEQPGAVTAHAVIQLDRLEQGLATQMSACWQPLEVSTTVLATDEDVVSAGFAAAHTTMAGACIEVDDVCVQVMP